MMDGTGMKRQQLSQSMADLKETVVLSLVRQRLGNHDDPLDIIEDCQEGMRQVGISYERRKYYLSGLILAGDILREVMEIVQPEVEKRQRAGSSGTVLLGTVKSDIHDLGKGIFSMLLSCYGFTVHDLGVNVSPDQFAAGYLEIQPDIVGLSGLLTGSYRPMRETIQLVRDAVKPGSSPPAIIIGGQVDDEVCGFVGADFWTVDAMDGIRWCQSHVQPRVQAGR